MTAKQRKRPVEERASYAVGHRIRIEVLLALHERAHSTVELARIIRQPMSTVTHHVEELLKDGSIEIGHTRTVRGIEQYFYRAIKLPVYTDEEIAALPFDERQRINGTVLEAVMAEALASFWAGKISLDPRSFLAWNWFNVDGQGRDEIADALYECWERMTTIEAESMNRVATSGEEPTSMIVSVLGYERARNAPHPPADYLGS
jgi:DNA-binding transcriptional ArsR family regulator